MKSADHPPPPDWARGPAAAIAAAARGASGVAVALRQGDRWAIVTQGRTGFDGAANGLSEYGGSEYGGSAFGGPAYDGSAYGGGSGPVTADTRFEVGSVTKCLTALLLAEQVARGEMAYGDPLSRFLPYGLLPRTPGGAITPLHLATHTSGLPRLPRGLLAAAAPQWFSNPYAAFTTADVLSSLAGTRTRTRPGDRVRYSNFGVGLLGHLLTVAAHDRPGQGGERRGARASREDPGARGELECGGRRYGELLAARVLEPLGLRHTGCAPNGPQATGHWHGRPRPSWRIPGLAGAGAVRSTARDLLALLDALLDPAAAPGSDELRAALADVVRPRLVLRGGAKRLALVWNIRVRPDGDIYHHSGGTRGFTSFAGFGPARRTAVVALANTGPAVDGAFIQSAYSALLALSRP
ncbi:class A beta-lactamase-related serine hydrolase [Streptomyces paludis]|uniref:Class A beta-lactamase-related serine hydrolase n=2 Tax=Streptomyces paludis TaxID=2282738 RepID=A0A345I263_9ACTN|nr:class A beta-lactamase-related serine hydrolase [Streptomyces paludis]